MRAIFFGGPVDGQERVVNSDRSFRSFRTPAGDFLYDLHMVYGDTLIYAYQLSLFQVMDLLVNHYLKEHHASTA